MNTSLPRSTTGPRLAHAFVVCAATMLTAAGCASKGTRVGQADTARTRQVQPDAQQKSVAQNPAVVPQGAVTAPSGTQEYADGGAVERAATITMAKVANGAGDGAQQVIYKDPLAELPADQLQRTLADRLAQSLREDSLRSDTPVAELSKLAALDAIEPGTFERVFGTLDQSDARNRLNPQELSFLAAWRDLHTQAGTTMNESGDISRLGGAVAGLTQAMGGSQTLAIPSALLCTKVDGFGVFTELKKYGDTYKLIAGRKQKLIVYTEVDNFAHRREVRDGVEGFNVELTQDLRLSFSGANEDVLAWRKSDERISDFSSKRRRDFFVVQIIELPETLTIGRYSLKVVLRDTSMDADSTGGVPAGRIAQAVIPIEIVADASALRDDQTKSK